MIVNRRWISGRKIGWQKHFEAKILRQKKADEIVIPLSPHVRRIKPKGLNRRKLRQQRKGRSRDFVEDVKIVALREP
jgi:hypothetical protein